MNVPSNFPSRPLRADLGAVAAEAGKAGGDPVEALRAAIKPVRYDSKGYYFIYDLNGYNMAHPLRPDFHGTHRIGTKDTLGKPLYQSADREGQIGRRFL